MYILVQPGETLEGGFHSRLDFIATLKHYVASYGIPKQLSCFVCHSPIYERLYLFQNLTSKQIKSILSLYGDGCGKASEGFSTPSAPQAPGASANNR